MACGVPWVWCRPGSFVEVVLRWRFWQLWRFGLSQGWDAADYLEESVLPYFVTEFIQIQTQCRCMTKQLFSTSGTREPAGRFRYIHICIYLLSLSLSLSLALFISLSLSSSRFFVLSNCPMRQPQPLSQHPRRDPGRQNHMGRPGTFGEWPMMHSENDEPPHSNKDPQMPS